MSQLFSQPPLKAPQQGGTGHLIAVHTAKQVWKSTWSPLTLPGREEGPSSCSVFSGTRPVGVLRAGWCHCHYSLRTVETRLPPSAFAGMGKAGLHFFCSVSLQQCSYCLTVFCLASCPFLASLATEQACFVWSGFTGNSGLLASLAPSLGYVRQRENTRGTSPLVLRSQTNLVLRRANHLLVLYRMSGF